MAILNVFSRRDLSGDLYGGLTAAVVALPLGLAFGVSSGVGAAAGVYSAVIVGLFAAIFGGTRTQISGPTGPMTVVMAGVVTTELARDPEHGLAVAFFAVMLAGVIQVLAGLLKLGKYVILVPFPVISGFMSGIGTLIILLQLGPLLGHPAPSDAWEAMISLPQMVSTLAVVPLVVGTVTLATIYLWPRALNRLVPSALAALIVGTLIAMVAFPGEARVIGTIPRGLPNVTLPPLQLMFTGDVLRAAILLAALGAIDSLLTSLVADNVTRTHHESDQELIGQGIGNFMAGLFGALPGAGATMRTVVNIRAGGNSAVSGVTHSIVLLAILLGAGFLAEDVPHAVLAGILFKVGYDIIDRRSLARIHRVPLFSSALMIGVLLCTVFIDLITAVLVGSFIVNLVTLSRLTNVQLDGVFLSDGSEDIAELEPQRERLAAANGKILLFELHGPMSFGVARGINRRLAGYRGHNILLIDLSNAVLVGITTSLVIEELIENEIENGNQVYLIGADNKQLAANLKRLGVFDLIPTEQQFAELEPALTRAIDSIDAAAVKQP